MTVVASEKVTEQIRKEELEDLTIVGSFFLLSITVAAVTPK